MLERQFCRSISVPNCVGTVTGIIRPCDLSTIIYTKSLDILSDVGHTTYMSTSKGNSPKDGPRQACSTTDFPGLPDVPQKPTSEEAPASSRLWQHNRYYRRASSAEIIVRHEGRLGNIIVIIGSSERASTIHRELLDDIHRSEVTHGLRL